MKESLSYKNVELWTLSGTGNTYRAAVWIRDEAQRRGIEARIRPIQTPLSAVAVEDSPETLLGILTPSHAFTAPWLAFRFWRHLPRVRRAHAFCFASRAGIKVGPVFPPGINGSGNFLLSLLLRWKGYRVRGAMSADMPCNWIAAHPGIGPDNAQAILDRAEPRVRAFGRTLLDGRTHWITRNNLYELFWGIVLFPITVLYLLIGRFFLAKLFFADNRCNGCGLCETNCPVGAIHLYGKKHPRPFWRYTCESCMRCMAYCPEQAVQASHSWAVAVQMIISLPVAASLVSGMTAVLPGSASVGGWLHWPANLLWHYAVIFLAYYVFYFLSRFIFPNCLFTYSTLTTWYRRYHAPGTKAGDLKRGEKEF